MRDGSSTINYGQNKNINLMVRWMIQRFVENSVSFPFYFVPFICFYYWNDYEEFFVEITLVIYVVNESIRALADFGHSEIVILREILRFTEILLT